MAVSASSASGITFGSYVGNLFGGVSIFDLDTGIQDYEICLMGGLGPLYDSLVHRTVACRNRQWRSLAGDVNNLPPSILSLSGHLQSWHPEINPHGILLQSFPKMTMLSVTNSRVDVRYVVSRLVVPTTVLPMEVRIDFFQVVLQDLEFRPTIKERRDRGKRIEIPCAPQPLQFYFLEDKIL